MPKPPVYWRKREGTAWSVRVGSEFEALGEHSEIAANKKKQPLHCNEARTILKVHVVVLEKVWGKKGKNYFGS